jgi:transcription termination factor Rho
MTRAYNIIEPRLTHAVAHGSRGVTQAKRFFGAARKSRRRQPAILGTARHTAAAWMTHLRGVQGTGNLVVHLDRKLSDADFNGNRCEALRLVRRSSYSQGELELWLSAR